MVDIHGASLVNILYCGNHTSGLLKIYPPSIYFSFHHILLANQLVYQCHGVIGLPDMQQYSGGFCVDPTELRQCLTALLQR